MPLNTLLNASMVNNADLSAFVWEFNNPASLLYFVNIGDNFPAETQLIGYGTRLNENYPREADWNTFVNTTEQGSVEREFTAYIATQMVDGAFDLDYFYCTKGEAIFRKTQNYQLSSMSKAFYEDTLNQIWEYHWLDN